MASAEQTPRIGIFGRRNYGKSTLLNAMAQQKVAIVSDVAGTTTDPVHKTTELPNYGPVHLIDTAGFDDDADALGMMRSRQSMDVLTSVNLALIIFAHNRFEEHEEQAVALCRQNHIPFILVASLCDVEPPTASLVASLQQRYSTTVYRYSAFQPETLPALLDVVARMLPDSRHASLPLLNDLVHRGDHLVLVVPIDSGAPAGRLILPQVQVLRNVLDLHASATVCRDDELVEVLKSLAVEPRLVITDSQVFSKVADIVPQQVPLTSFSVVLAHSKGPFDLYIKGTPTISSLKDGDKVLILESCSHQTSCHDIGRQQLPAMLQRYTQCQLQCDILAGSTPLQKPITDYALVIQCGGCVVSQQQLMARLSPAKQNGIPITNYGLAISYINGIFDRAISPFKTKKDSSNETF